MSIRRSKKFLRKFKFGRKGNKRSVIKAQAVYSPEVHSMLRDKNINQTMVRNVNHSSLFAYRSDFQRVELNNGQVWDVAKSKHDAMEIAVENTMMQLHDDPSEFGDDFLKTIMFNQEYFDSISEIHVAGLINGWREMNWRERQDYLIANGLDDTTVKQMLEMDADLGILLDGRSSEEYFVEKVSENYNPLDDETYKNDLNIIESGNDKKINEFVKSRYASPEDYRSVAQEFINVEGINIALSDDAIVHSPSSSAVYWKRTD